MKYILRNLLAVLAFGVVSAACGAPSTAFVRANRACTVTADGDRSSTDYSLTTVATAADGGEWYGSSRLFVSDDLELTASVPGYSTAWYSYAKDVSSSKSGPKAATQLLGNGEKLVVGDVLDKLYGSGSPSVGLFYAKFTPITYSLKYELDGGEFGKDSFHPASATNDVPFTVSAPTRVGHSFSGWESGGKKYFKGETADVTVSNLTTTAGATVTLTATWTPRQYALVLTVGEGIGRIRYRLGETMAWTTVTGTTTVLADYASTWQAYAEPLYGYSLSGTGSREETPASGTITLSGGKFEPVATKVKFVVTTKASPIDGGTASGGGTYEYQSEVELTALAGTGRRFAGWSDGAKENPHKITVLCATNVTVCFQPQPYELRLVRGEGVATLHYRLGGSGDYASTNATCTVSVPYGTKYETYIETAPGYSFSGLGAGIGTPSSGTMGTGGAVFEPKPTRVQYGVTTKAEPTAAGTTKVNLGGRFYYGEQATVEANPHTGWKFTQWSDGATENPHNITVLSNVYVSAQFEREIYTVIFRWRNANGAEAWEESQVAFEGAAVPPTADKVNCWPGHRFTAWNSSAYLSVKGDCEVEASYAANSYTVKFNGNGADGGLALGDQKFEYGKSQTLTVNQFMRTGYVFLGWARDPKAVAAEFGNGDNVSDLLATDSGVLTLYAVWKPIEYVIRFDGNGASGSMPDKHIKYEDAVALNCTLQNPPFSLIDWYDAESGLSYTNGETVVRLAAVDGAVVTLTAEWTSQCYVSFDANGGTGEMGRQTFEKNVERALLPNAFTHAGHRFLGWSLTDTGAVEHVDQALVKNPTAAGKTRTLFAKWVAEDPIIYTVIFDANGGEGKMANRVMTYGKPEPISNEFDPPGDGWIFSGWSNQLDSVVYSASAVSNLTTIANDHVRLYAVWTADMGERSAALGCDNLKFVANPDAVWTIMTSGGLTNGTAQGAAWLSANKRGGGVLTFEWRASAVGEEWGQTTTSWIEQDERRTNTTLSVLSGDVTVTNVTGVVADSWQKVVCRIEDESEALRFSQNSFGRLYPCMLRNVRWESTETIEKNVTFELGSGARVGGGETSQTVAVGGEALEPTLVADDGWTFVGWDKTNEWKDVTADTLVTAQYVRTKYNLIYADTQGADNSANPKMFTADDQVVFEPLGVTGFDRWAPAEVKPGTSGDVVVTALWSQVERKFHDVTFNCGAHGTADPASLVQSVEDGKNALTPELTVAPGWQFLGWSSSLDGISGDLAVTAQYAVVSYPIAYENLKGVPNSNPLTYTVTNEVTFSAPYDQSVPYRFSRWEPSSLPVGTTGPQTITAVWSNGVTFALGDRLVRTGGGELVQYVADGGDAVEPTVEVKDEYKTAYAFTGWDKSFSDVREAMSVAAVVSEKPKFAVTVGGISRAYHVGEKAEVFTAASVTNGTTNVVCVGWVGTGDVPAQGTSNSVSFVVTQASTLTWQYETNYWVRVEAADGGTVEVRDGEGAVATQPGWFAAGTNLTAVATPDEGWAFLRWEANGASLTSGEDAASPLMSFAVDGAMSLRARFERRTFRVKIGGTDMTCTYGSNVVATTVASVTNGTTNVVCVGWVGTGDVPARGTSNCVSFVVTQASTLMWQYETNYWVRVEAAEGGTVEVCDGEGAVAMQPGWFAAGKGLTAKATANVGWKFKEWTDESTGPCSGMDATFAFAVICARSLQAVFEVVPSPGPKPGPEPEPEKPVVTNLTVGAWAFTEGVTEISATVRQGVYAQWAVSAREGTVKVSGLPSGLKYTAKAKKDTVTGLTIPAGSVYGSPSTAKTATSKFTVTTTVGRKKTKTVYKLVLTVTPLPTEIIGKYVGGTLGDSAGSVELTVAKTGKITGKWKSEGATWTLKATGFDGVVGGTGAYRATMSAKSGRVSETLQVLFDTADVASGATHAAGTVGVAVCELFDATYVNWKAAPWKSLATALKKAKFDVTDSKVTLSGTVGTYGTVSVKGSFDVGASKPYTATVKGTLVPLGGDAFELFLYYPPKKNKFDGWAVRLVLRWDGSSLEVVE